MNKVLGLKEIAQAFGVSRQTIFNWLDAGMPRTESGKFDLPVCIKWRIRHELKRKMPMMQVRQMNALLRSGKVRCKLQKI